jgi:hypothetical protein
MRGMTTLTQYAKAAQHLRMSWLTQSEFPAKALVKDSFRDAIAELPASTGYQDNLVRSALQSIVDGPDPRGGPFKAQAIYAAAQLHDRVVSLALEPKVKKPKVRAGSILYGYCGGLLDDSYGHRIVLSVGKGWMVYQPLDAAVTESNCTYRGNLKELAEYLVPDHHCPENCILGQD